MSCNIGHTVSNDQDVEYDIASLLNHFMKIHYGKRKYINSYNCLNDQIITYQKNILVCYESNILFGIYVKNKKLFKNIIVIIKCIIDNITKQLEK